MIPREFRRVLRKAEETNTEIITDYSGRGMFGRECIALICRTRGEMRLWLEKNGLMGRMDGFGLEHVVVYYPYLESAPLGTHDELLAYMTRWAEKNYKDEEE